MSAVIPQRSRALLAAAATAASFLFDQEGGRVQHCMTMAGGGVRLLLSTVVIHLFVKLSVSQYTGKPLSHDIIHTYHHTVK